MPDRKPEGLPTPQIVIDAADAIKTKGKFQRDLTGPEVAGLVKGIVSELVTGNPQVKGNIPFMDVQIDRGQANVKGTIRIDKPIGATVGVDIQLVNALNVSDSIRLGDLKIQPKADNFIGGAALKALNIEKMARQTLQNPTNALKEYLAGEMRGQGARLDSISMRFTPENKFAVSLGGSKL